MNERTLQSKFTEYEQVFGNGPAPFVVESAVGVHHALVPVLYFGLVDVDRVLHGSEHLVRGVCVVYEERICFASGFECVAGKHRGNTDRASCQGKCPCGHGLKDNRRRRLAEVCRKQGVGSGEGVAELQRVVVAFEVLDA